MPEIVAALASPLSKVDKITVVSTGNNGSTGMHKVTSDLTEIAAQVPALVEALSGVPMGDLLSKVRKLGDSAGRPPVGVSPRVNVGRTPSGSPPRTSQGPRHGDEQRT